MKLEALTRPIEPQEIEWKIQSYTKDKSKTIIVPYVTARCVMDRLDEAFGVLNWSTKFEETKSGMLCTITAEGVSKQDGASLTTIEPIKGGISDSLKRAAHQFGIGRGLYDYPRVMLKGEIKFIPEETLTRLHKMTEVINQGKFTQNIVII